MRPVLHADVVAAARALLRRPASDRYGLIRRMIRRAEIADRHRKQTGRMHRLFGDGSLELAVTERPGLPEPFLDDPEYCDCMITVLDALVARFQKKCMLPSGTSS